MQLDINYVKAISPERLDKMDNFELKSNVQELNNEINRLYENRERIIFALGEQLQESEGLVEILHYRADCLEKEIRRLKEENRKLKGVNNDN